MLNDIGQSTDAATISRKVLSELSRPFHIEGNQLDISCSIGISVFPDDGKDIATLMINADKAMYHAKRTGRSNYQFFAPGMGVAGSKQ
ncbi:Cyclic di-GMP phosphodiesterase Gmr [compost metagenome]